MKRKIILLSGCILCLMVVLVGTTYAWLTQETSTEITYNVGKVNYEISSTNTNNKVVPGETLGSITITNKSNIKTELRAAISVNTDNWTAGTTATSDKLLLTLSANWIKNESDDFYYYSGAIPETTTSTTIESPFTIIINGDLVGNTDADKEIKLTITFQVKQADHITWDNMGNIDFITGLKNSK